MLGSGGREIGVASLEGNLVKWNKSFYPAITFIILHTKETFQCSVHGMCRMLIIAVLTTTKKENNPESRMLQMRSKRVLELLTTQPSQW